jgi:hypothetical protein
MSHQVERQRLSALITQGTRRRCVDAERKRWRIRLGTEDDKRAGGGSSWKVPGRRTPGSLRKLPPLGRVGHNESCPVPI